MLPCKQLRAFADALTLSALPTRHEIRADLPDEVSRLLIAAGGRACGDVHFIGVADVDAMRARLNDSSLWNPAWWPLAATSTEIYAYDPVGCFRRTAGRIVSFDVGHGDRWLLIPGLSLWIGALMEARGRGANVAAVARDWLIARGQLFQVVPASTDVGDDRFALPPVGLQYADHQVEHTDFTLFILHAMSSGLDPAPVLRDIARALDAALPYCNLAELATAPLDDAAALARTVLIPYFAKHAAAKNVERLVFQFESGARPRFGVWAGPTASKPVRTEATGLGFECMRAVHEMIESSPLGVTTETGTFIHATSAFLVRALLDAAAPALPWEHELDVYLGSIRLGRCDRDGFVPTPIPIARAQLLLERERTTAGLVRMGFPGIPPTTIDYPVPAAAATRSLRHPDGRRWGGTIRGERLHSTLIEGTETETFKRPVKTGWELETFVAAQLRAGFVDAGSE